MKTNLEKLNSLYDSCKIILEESDPCKLKSEGCFCANRQDKDKTLLCCSDCSHCKDKKCTTRNFACIVYTCSPARQNLSRERKTFQELETLLHQLNLKESYFISYEEFLNEI